MVMTYQDNRKIFFIEISKVLGTIKIMNITFYVIMCGGSDRYSHWKY